ncbi:MAG: M1 family metallopeptidase [Bacillota bacterium]|nr:M1 family metallopeptidase [Bacillota bacterium]
MRNLAVVVITLLLLVLIVLPAKEIRDTIERPLYCADVTFDPAQRSLSAKLNYKLPPGDYAQIVFTVYANAYEQGINGNFVFPQFTQRVFYLGDSKGSVVVSDVRVNGVMADFALVDTALTITPRSDVLRNRPVEVTMDYIVTVPMIGHRNGANQHAVWAGNWLPLLAVREGQTWLTYPYYSAGDPFHNQVADFAINIEVPTGYTLIVPGEVQQTNSTYTVFARNIREFAIVLGPDYTPTTRTSRQGIELSFYTYNASPNTVNRLLDELLDMIDYFTAEVGPYSYPSLRFVQTSWFLGGMEYPGVVLLSDTTLQNYYSVRSTMLHELAHQWFYAIIGSNQVTDAWIDEGLATFFQQRYLQGSELDSYYAKERATLAPLLKTHPDVRLGQPLDIYGDWSHYYRVNYRRSSLMQYDLFKLMGADKYRLFTQSLYNEYKDSELDKTGLIRLASEAYGHSLESWFYPWFND